MCNLMLYLWNISGTYFQLGVSPIAGLEKLEILT